MGGSFNPPTLAHLAVMQTALEKVRADLGLFVPVSFPYLKRKMIRAGQSHLCLPDEIRVRALEAMAAEDPRLRVCTLNMHSPFSDDTGIMQLIQEAYPDSVLYYASGADKLDLLDHFAAKGGFFDRFRCVLYARNSADLAKEIAGHEHLAAHLPAFVLMDAPPGMEQVSSTAVRRHLFDLENAAGMLHPGAAAVLEALKQEDFPEEILQFSGDFAFLSGSFPAHVLYEGISYPCADSAFLASRFNDPDRKKVISGMNPAKAKQKYCSFPGYPGWEAESIRIMEDIVRAKFHQHPDLMELLISTRPRRLINGGRKDSIWGMNLTTWQGENRLGRILMDIRTEETRL